MTRPRTERQSTLRGAQKATTLELLTDAAREVFSEVGYTATIAEICKHASVSRGTFYLHFETKGHVLAHLYAQDYVAALPAWLNDFPECADLDPLIAWVESYIEMFRANQAIIDAWVEAGVQERGLMQKSKDIINVFFDALGSKVLAMRQAHGVATEATDAWIRGSLTYTMMHRATYFLVSPGFTNLPQELQVRVMAEHWQSTFGRVPESLSSSTGSSTSAAKNGPTSRECLNNGESVVELTRRAVPGGEDRS